MWNAVKSFFVGDVPIFSLHRRDDENFACCDEHHDLQYEERQPKSEAQRLDTSERELMSQKLCQD